MKKSHAPFLIVALAMMIGGYIALKPATPMANAEIAATYQQIPTSSDKALFMQQSENLTTPVDPMIAYLDAQLITCNPNVDNLLAANPSVGGSCVAGGSMLSTTTGMYLSGQCCGPMKDLAEYNKELASLQQYKNIPDIPMDPYKTPVPVAKKWIDYDHSTVMGPQEQATMDQAMKMSKEGPCCCKCWHYFVNDGIAKKMIRVYHYSAQQVAQYWSASSIC